MRWGQFTPWAVALALFLISLTARATALGSFAWPDELTWLERSAAFVTALERGDLAGTYLTDHPGVAPMWGFGAALYLRAWLTGDRTALDALAVENYHDDVPTQLATAAWFTVLCTSLAVVAAYGLLTPLLGRAGAALGGLLLALNPFYLTHSRIVHVDALLASFMLLSTLSLLVYLKFPDRRRFLFLSGVMGGLALLTKQPALFLLPLTALALGVQWLLGDKVLPQWKRRGLSGATRPRRRTAGRGRAAWGALGQAAGGFGLWLATLALTYFLLWPATWRNPLFFLWRMYKASRWGATVPHGSNFFLGQVVADPGPLFYPVVLPFRLSPGVLVLLPLSLFLLVVAWKRQEDIRLPLIGLAFILFFTGMMSLAAKKGDRYLLPVYPMADVTAAWTVLALLDGLARRARDRVRTWRLGYGLAVGLALLTSLLWLRLAPYYGAYFNPLLGGGPMAVKTFAFGQGEGLDLAAQYLNGKENSAELMVVSFYPPQFRYYFDGQATSLRRKEWDQTWLFADYVVFYVSQVQRQLPTAALVDFFGAQEPEYVVRLGGVDFARVYPSPVLLSGQPPGVEQALSDRRLGENLGLVGYALSTDRPQAGDRLYATLSWQALSQLGVDYEFQALLVGEGGQVVWRQARPPFDGYFPTSWWRPGKTMYDRYEIELPGDLDPGRYQLLVSARDPLSGQGLEPHGPTHDRWPDHLLVSDIWVAGVP